jgi:hypothetical protein
VVRYWWIDWAARVSLVDELIAERREAAKRE